MNGDMREALRTGDLDGLVIRRQRVGIYEASTDEEYKYFPCASRDPRGKGPRREMCCFLVAFGTKVTIGLVCTHHRFLPDVKLNFIAALTSNEIPFEVKPITKNRALLGYPDLIPIFILPYLSSSSTISRHRDQPP